MRTRWTILNSIFITVLLTTALYMVIPVVYAAEQLNANTSIQQNNATENAEIEIKGLKAQRKLIGKADKAKNYLVETSRAYSKPLLIGGIMAGVAVFILGVFLGPLSKKTGETIRGAALGIIGSVIIGFFLVNNAPEIGSMINSFWNWIIN